ncbi:CotH kinase family protein [Corynebacterium stationis]|uniref:CotH kinase family protein n=1 Tax=Corynebacterium stationis TaxID=1705 RepID=UPI00273B5D60|nr:CotH kinase family protein [Corynebacterium stationis]WLP87677.1 CotH kinase family protein [Corynebacterium stationis]
MLSTFREDGEKEYIRADITIDGTLIEDVGLRLKGNSTLQSLSNNSMGGGGGGGMTQLFEDNPEELPWLISFDEYEEGRAYQGMTEIALRPAASGSEVAINEALALELTAESGQITQDYTFTSVTVNGSESAARIVVDAPDTEWADELGSGVLYKARAGGSLDYVGDDPTEYEDSFKQINAEGAYDLQPVMTLMKFLNESTDEEFAEELDDYVDTESFAKYLATQEILSNNDAMDGPGNNYYLWYDTTEKQFTVLSWDLNLALFGRGGGMGGGVGGMQQDTETGTATDIDDTATTGEMPALLDGMEMPGGEEGEGAGPSGGSDSGILKERFLDNEEFYAMYEQAYAELYEQLIASRYAEETLNELTTRAEKAGDEGAATLAESIRSSLASLSETAPEPSAGMGMGPGRKTATTASETTETTEDV